MGSLVLTGTRALVHAHGQIWACKSPAASRGFMPSTPCSGRRVLAALLQGLHAGACSCSTFAVAVASQPRNWSYGITPLRGWSQLTRLSHASQSVISADQDG